MVLLEHERRDGEQCTHGLQDHAQLKIGQRAVGAGGREDHWYGDH